ncbi:hypothetical protein E1301_Tti021802 [Triplophysa tibetana]|uniref:Ig-like domain-containing protein n=1 Tax=Triplophysa tibetana TaxID=1572043 RepID=A0A5A9NQI2_9TELE|nr:hypothetical protein E1301_Tti021802 [Triplophysa tibetana]
MIYKPGFFALCLWLARGVFGVDPEEVKSVSAMDGDSVTLHTNLTHIQTDIQILWTFKLNTRLAEIIKREQMNIFFVSKDVIFRDHLQMNNQTGSLNITNIKTEHTGLYQLQIISDKISYTSFTVIVHAHLPVPVIIRNSSQCSSSSERSSVSKCVLMCSVMNVTHVNLSWYKGNSLFSSISVSDLNIRLSLPLEVEYHDTNTYRCVVSNPITNHTQHLNINDVCQPCSDFLHLHFILLTAVAVMLPVVISVILVWRFKKYKKQKKQDQTLEEEIIYTEAKISTQQFHNTNVVEEDHTEYSSVVTT